jgi:PAP2 superfamily
VTAGGRAGPGGRRRSGWVFPDATAPAAALAAALLGLILGAAGVLGPLVVAAGLAWRWRRGTWRPMALLAAAAVYGMPAVLLARSGRRAARGAVFAGAAALIALVGLSRLYLGVHWLSDVVAGAGLGIAWVLAIFIAGRVGEPRGYRVGWVLPAAMVAIVLLLPEAVEGLGAPVHAAAAPLGHPLRQVARRTCGAGGCPGSR